MATGKPLSWVFELHDGMSGPARQIVINLNQVQDATQKVKEEAKDAGGILDTALGTGLERAAEKMFSFGKQFVEDILAANRAAERTKIAFEVLTGSAGQSVATFEEVKRVANALGAPVEAVSESYRELLLGGEDVTNLQLITKAAADLSALSGGTIGQWAQNFADIRSKGELAGRSLMAFKGVIDFDDLSKRLGFTTHGFKALMSELNKAPVSAQKGIEAILNSLAAKEGGALEGVSHKLRDTFSGTISTIKEEFLELFQFDSGQSMLLDFLHGVRDALDPDGPLVGKLREGAMAFLEGLGLLTKGDGNGGGMAGLIQSLKDGSILGEDFRGKMKEVGEDVRVVAEALGIVARGIVSVSKALTDLHGGGFREMVASGAVREATTEEAARAVPASSLSPAERYGGFVKAALHGLFGDEETGQMVIPKMASGGRVTSPTLALIGDGGEPESVIPDSQLGRGGVRLHVEQHFHIDGAGNVDVRDLARNIHDVGLPDLQGALDSLAQSMGVA